MSKFIYTQMQDLALAPSELLVNPLNTLDTQYTPVRLRFHFTASDILIDTQILDIPFVNQRVCDLVGACLTFSPLVDSVFICEYPYLKDNAIWLDLAVELTRFPLSSTDLINMYSSYFTGLLSPAVLAKLPKRE